MKKIALLFFCVLSFSFLNAQQILSKDGRPVLPEKGDWGLGIDVTRMISIAGIRFSQPVQLISAKYMIDSTHAARFGVRLAFDNTVTRNRTVDRVAESGSVQAYPAAQEMKDNVWHRNYWMVGLSYGKEKRRGHRLQGIYGMEGIIALSQLSEDFKYANALDASPQSRIPVDPVGDAMYSSEFGGANNIDSFPPIQGVNGPARIVKRREGLTVSVAARAFAGAEYFFVPKMSIGAELGWGIGFSMRGRSVTVLESEGNSTVPGSTGPSVGQTTIDGDSFSSFSFGHDVLNPNAGLSASVRLHLWF